MFESQLKRRNFRKQQHDRSRPLKRLQYSEKCEENEIAILGINGTAALLTVSEQFPAFAQAPGAYAFTTQMLC